MRQSCGTTAVNDQTHALQRRVDGWLLAALLPTASVEASRRRLDENISKHSVSLTSMEERKKCMENHSAFWKLIISNG